MTRDEVMAFWIESAEEDSQVMESLFRGGHYVWALFVGHLVLEKLFKALYVRNVDVDVPRTHNLPLLADRAGAELTEAREEFLEVVTRFNVEARYPDYKGRFHRKATREFTIQHMEGIWEARRWLLTLLGS
jgi:HEPN domain-containing protein